MVQSQMGNCLPDVIKGSRMTERSAEAVTLMVLILYQSEDVGATYFLLSNKHLPMVFLVGRDPQFKIFHITALLEALHCVKSVQIRSFFWSAFSCIRTEYENSSKYRKIRTRKNSVFGYFSRNVVVHLCMNVLYTFILFVYWEIAVTGSHFAK